MKTKWIVPVLVALSSHPEDAENVVFGYTLLHDVSGRRGPMGTPSGVGVARDPQVFMKPGDVAACSIESIGTLTNPVAGH